MNVCLWNEYIVTSSAANIEKTLAEKIATIKEVGIQTKKKFETVTDFGIPPNTLSIYFKNKEKILRSENKGDKGRKRLRVPENPNLDSLLQWFNQSRNKKITLSDLFIRSKAEQFAIELRKTISKLVQSG